MCFRMGCNHKRNTAKEKKKENKKFPYKKGGCKRKRNDIQNRI